jgi:hypothetical protein
MHSYYDVIAWKREQAKKRANQNTHWKEIFEQIKAHSQTRVLARGDIPEAYEYVEDLFPRCAEPLSKTLIYKNDNTAFFPRIGLPAAGGMYIRPVGAVIICYAKEFSDDVVAVHELLHCTHALLGSKNISERQEEDFAYGKSIPYLLGKGYDEEWIVKKYLWPFYFGEAHTRNPTRDKEAVEAECRSVCLKLIRVGVGGVDVEEEKKPSKGDRFDLI